ncbi:pentatricopeptide repeat-containing protein [Senna tora]|uniref:Pentatricopeptide repeat-containing protein n=1 Tax=Senna tora TaxID=362788 RepID=A0A834X8G3_9FABA|nr:pentatricopeptide repeat-containing protein [Senna tora]
MASLSIWGLFRHFCWSALIDVYSKCSCSGEARLVFEETHEKDIVVWNAMFLDIPNNWKMRKALKLYKDLRCQA